MIVYHGTTRTRARRICKEGFRPRKPSKRVWFAQSRNYALGRARTQARRAHDRPMVLRCELNLAELRRRIGKKRIFHRGANIAINAPLPVSVLRSAPTAFDQPATPEDLAAWVNRVLDVKPWKGVGAKHPGIDRLSTWVINRLADRPESRIKPTELLAKARQWLPAFFEGVVIDCEHLRVVTRMKPVEVEVKAPLPRVCAREAEAIDCLESPHARRRVRGLGILADIDEPDLFDWCAIFLDDESVTVVEAALRMMLRCDTEAVDIGLIVPLVKSQNKRIRGAALAALARHGGDDAPRWFERGLKDPSPCVRTKTARMLEHLDVDTHHETFELALYDPNPQVARTARKLTAGKGFAKLRWSRA